MFRNNFYQPYKTGYFLKTRDKSRTGSKKESKKFNCQNTYVLTTLVSNYYFKESDIEGNIGYKKKFGFEEENIYKERTQPYRPDFVRALEEVGYTETAHLKGVC